MKKISNREWQTLFTQDTEKKDKELFLKHISQGPGHPPENPEGSSDKINRNPGDIFIKIPKKQKIILDDTLDLHTKTKEEADVLLKEFINNCYAHQDAMILIIPGKGHHSKKKGVLKDYVKQWLISHASDKIKWAAVAPPSYGGEGAIIVRLNT